MADAVKKRYLDSLVTVTADQVKACMDSKDNVTKSYLAEMANLKQQIHLQSEINSNSGKIIGTFKQETNYYKKKARRHRNERNLAILVYVGTLIGIIAL